MICTYKYSTWHKCFAANNGWTKPCDECPTKEEIQTWLNMPEQQTVIKRTNEIINKLLEKDTEEVT
jgi:hypothetical protein